jgi:hypothetical protein
LRLDLDHDGDLELVFTAYELQSMWLYRNDFVTGAHWLRVFLQSSLGSGVAPDGFGARVRSRIGSEWQLRAIDGGGHYLTQSELSAHFGTGSATVQDELVVEWPDGVSRHRHGVPVDRTLCISR